MNVFEWGKALVVDDYAHHPTEIRMVLETIKTSFSDRKNCVIFQPHLFSRTQDFMEGFVSVLEEFDEVAILDIYPAREEPIPWG
jgi:UDP-N-acetylmuramate--alanine ligase